MQNPIDAYKQKPTSNKKKVFLLSTVLAGVAIAAFGINSEISLSSLQQEQKPNTSESKYIDFTAEAYNKIQGNYWEKLNEKKLSGLFKKGMTKISKQNNVSLSSQDLAGVKKELTSQLENLKDEKKERYVTTLTRMVLESLPPQGRNKLYGKKEKKDLANRVNNVNPKNNLYSNLSLKKEAPKEKVEEKTKQKKQELREEIEQVKQRAETASTEKEKEEAEKQKEEAEEKLKKVEYSKEVLTDEESKKRYDTTGAEPTVFKRRLTPDIVHIYIEKFSPTTLKELKKAVDSVDMSGNTPSSLILDLRANVGGSIDLAPYILGPFIGKGHTAYKTYQQDNKKPIKTKTGWMNGLVPYKKVVVLADEKTQSTGEVFVSTLKKYNVGVLVGETTRGWGTIERVFKMDTSLSPNSEYGLFLVHHITLRADGKPIQGRGVNPDIDITSDNWKKKLDKYFNSPELIKNTEKIWNSNIPGK